MMVLQSVRIFDKDGWEPTACLRVVHYCPSEGYVPTHIVIEQRWFKDGVYEWRELQVERRFADEGKR